MARGRKAEAGTYEAREYVTSEKFNKWVELCPVSKDAKKRIEKAICFGLGVKDGKIYKKEKEKDEKIVKLKKELKTESDGWESVKELADSNKITKKECEKSINDDVEGDEYFKPEDCYEA